MNGPYKVFDTPMRPCRWKVATSLNEPKSNATCNYFRTYEEAYAEAQKRNAREHN